MSEMVERVARAIYSEFENRPEYARSQMNGLLAEELARAAIEAMREPTEAMIEASNREWDGRMSHRSTGAWQAMVDAAISENATA